ncbi:hypothetical protein Val02_20020 [Virgisporangium aliadipatigenens]|uniref:Uncharacterized protein n=1 Tax=Virgisporangium aliadipatigenens TaxID=741659 RepID=A0A8J4DPN8_9ACTN|nr:hypothetical protein [Virgisporangium aliadipatigenens]GIJ45116.1 hypothetical protein Val02_20020 [Virgisporangium aliadipatigenens]
MRFAVLYARSRRLPVAHLTAVAVALGGALIAPADGGAGPVLTAFVAVVCAGVLGTGLTGADPALERTAAIAWVPRRALHVAAIAAVLAALASAVDGGAHPAALRDAVGTTGLLALGATALGARTAWALPLAWFAGTVFLPAERTAARWMFVAGPEPASTRTAVLLGLSGLCAYALFGNRR